MKLISGIQRGAANIAPGAMVQRSSQHDGLFVDSQNFSCISIDIYMAIGTSSNNQKEWFIIRSGGIRIRNNPDEGFGLGVEIEPDRRSLAWKT